MLNWGPDKRTQYRTVPKSHGPIRGPLGTKATPEAVHRVADALLAVGITPTIDLITRQIGGSKSTVTPLLAAWWERQSRTPQAIQKAEVVQAEQRLRDLIQGLTRSLSSADQRATTSESAAQAAHATATAAQQAAVQANQERDAALAAAAGAVNTANEVTELRRLVLADATDRRRTRTTIARLARRVAAMRTDSHHHRR